MLEIFLLTTSTILIVDYLINKKWRNNGRNHKTKENARK